MAERGLFLVLEGVEGSGKSTQAELLGRWLDRVGLAYTRTREPGGTPSGEAIRAVLLDRVDLSMPPETELFLLLAARAAFVQEVVRPALASGAIVLSDRFELSTFAYQGFGRGLDLNVVREANSMATGGLEPDLYIFLDVSAADGLQRHRSDGKEEDRIERSGVEFLNRVREGYGTLLEHHSKAEIVDGSGDPGDVHRLIVEALTRRFPETFRGDAV